MIISNATLYNITPSTGLRGEKWRHRTMGQTSRPLGDLVQGGFSPRANHRRAWQQSWRSKWHWPRFCDIHTCHLHLYGSRDENFRGPSFISDRGCMGAAYHCNFIIISLSLHTIQNFTSFTFTMPSSWKMSLSTSTTVYRLRHNNRSPKTEPASAH